MKKEVCFLVALLTSLAVLQGRADELYFAPAADDNNNFWDNAGGWKTSAGFVNRLPTDTDAVSLNAAKVALAGQGIESPHPLRITNGVKAVAKTIKIASVDASSDSSYDKTGRVIGLQIEEGGFLHTHDSGESFTIGSSSAGYGVLTMTGGMISNYAVNVGYEGIGVMTNAGGTVMLPSSESALIIGRYEGSKGTLAMTNGLLRHAGWNWNNSNITVAHQGQGVFELSGGVVSNKVIVGTGVGGCGHVKMSGGLVVNRVFVGGEPGATGDFDFTGGEIRGHIFVGNRGRGRMTFDGGSTYCQYVSMANIVPDYTGAPNNWGLVVGNQSGSYGELILKKPGLTFFSSTSTSRELLCGYFGEGHVQSFVDFEVPYLRIGGNTDSMSSYTAYAATTTTVVRAAFAGGYSLAALDGSANTFQYPGNGEIVLSNAVLRLIRDETNVTTPQLYVGRHAGGFGVLRGCGAVQGKSPTANNARVGLGCGQIIGDGYGEQRALDLNVIVSVTNVFANADDGTNGWYAVNKGAVLFPRVWLSLASDTRVIGTWTRNETPDFVNSVGFSLNNVPSPGGNGYYVRGGLYAADRSDVHANALPKNGSVVGIWKLGVFSALVDLTTKSFGSVDLTFRYDHTKVKEECRLSLYRWNGSSWSCVTSAKASENPRISCSGLAPVAGETYNVGTFALMCRETKGFQMIVR